MTTHAMTPISSIWASVPGKVIITGEHAVLYGQPALASAINLSSYARCHLVPQTSSNPQAFLSFPQIGWQIRQPIHKFVDFADIVIHKHQQFLQGQIPQADILPQATDLLVAALGYACQKAQFPVSADIVIELKTDLLLGGGMGSSASLVAAMFTAVANVEEEQVLSQEQLFHHVLQTEQWQHGRSSGLDPRACIFGGGVVMQSSQCRKVHLSSLPSTFLVSSGQPRSSTGSCVEHVSKQARSDTYWQQFGHLEEAIEQAMLGANLQTLISLIGENHRLLHDLGVVPAKVEGFIEQIERSYGAAKICGAGSIQGESGGLLMVVGVDVAQINKICTAYGYQYWPVVWQQQGVAYGG